MLRQVWCDDSDTTVISTYTDGSHSVSEMLDEWYL